MRPKALLTLLESVNEQILYPDEIIIVDGSTNEDTKHVFEQNSFKNLRYFKVEDKDRGLTKQRNYGIEKVSAHIDIVCFLDDDIVLTENYFKNLIGTYSHYPNAGGVGGYIINEISWRQLKPNEKPRYEEYEIDGYVRNLGSRNVLRKKFGLLSKERPSIMSKHSNDFPITYLPPNKETYFVDFFLGGVSSFKKEVVDKVKFSTYFIGYGLYEDLEYCLRVSKQYKLYVNTDAKLYHYHEEGGRPNKYKYGRMVIKNGWYVWRTKYPKLPFKYKLKWYSIMLLLTAIKFSNVFTKSKKRESFFEACGRLFGLVILLFKKPKIIN